MPLLASRDWLDSTKESRSLWRHPGYALTVILTLALGIGAVTTVYALVQGVLLNALPYPHAERLMLVRQQNAQTSWNTSVVDFRAIESSSAFDSVAAMRTASALVGQGENAQWANARWVTGRFFDVMGIAPARGRGFLAGDDRPGAAPAVVLSRSFAERRFGASDPLGQSLTIDGQAHAVVGVMPAGVETWAVMRADFWPVMQLAEPERRGPFFLGTLVRLKPDVTPAHVAADLDALSRRLFRVWQAGFQDQSARLTPQSLHGAVTGGVGGFLWLAFAAVTVVMLIALLNTSNLVLMRVAQRAEDLSVRAALGASRWRLARLLMIENLQLVALGSLGGLVLAAFLLSGYRALGSTLPRLSEVSMSPSVIGFVAGVVIVSALVLAALPVVFGAIGDSSRLHQGRSSSASKRQQRLRDGLVVLELALALPLLIAAGLLVDSLVRLQRVDPGFESERLLTASVRLSEDTYADDASRLAFWDRALPALRHMPGVEGAALMGVLPPNCGCYNNFALLGRPPAQGGEPQAPWIAVDAGFFPTLGVRLLEGRLFDARDTPQSPRVLVVSQSWAHRYFPGESAVGKELYEGGDTSRVHTVIGVVGDVKFDGLQAAGDAVFAPTGQGWGGNELYVALRTTAEPLSVSASMRSVLQRLDPAIVPNDIEPMETLLHDSLGGQRHWAAVVATFAIAAVLLSAVGVFGVFAYHVAHRQREIGIRQALGADARIIVRTVLRRGLACALSGAALGSVLAQFATQSLNALLFEVKATDPLTWLFAWAMLLLVALAACWVPALRASRVDPLRALRQE